MSNERIPNSDEPVAPANEAAETEERDDTVIVVAFRWSLAVIAVLACLAAGVFYYVRNRDTEVVAPVKPAEPPRLREQVSLTLPQIPFVDVTVASGIDFTHHNGATGEKLLPETMGPGCLVLDWDVDGDQDIVFVNSQSWPWDIEQNKAPAAQPTMSAWRNEGDWKFVDATEEVGLDISFYGMGGAVGDYDNDGDPDLFLTAVGLNRLLRNDNGRFVDATADSGVAGVPEQWSTSAGWFDSDNDGDLDLFVCNYVAWSRELDLAQPFQLVGDERAYGRPTVFEGVFPYLYRNDGQGKFTDVSEAAGIQVRNPATNVPMAKSLGVTFVDIDRDGAMDIVVANDTVQNFLFRNTGTGTFEEIGRAIGVAFDDEGRARGAMGIDAAWFRNDESLGIAIGNFSNEMTALYVATNGVMPFKDEAVATGLGPFTRLELTFGVCWGDLDLDGRLDLFASNGHLEDKINQVQPAVHFEQPPHVFWNCGSEHEQEFLPLSATECRDELFQPIVGRGSVLADFDEDGDLDVLIATCAGKARLLRNDQTLSHNWLRLELEGTRTNRSALGAIVEVTADGATQRRHVMAARSYLSSGELPVSFGLGKQNRIERIRIIWPDGNESEHPEIQLNRKNRIKQPNNPADDRKSESAN